MVKTAVIGGSGYTGVELIRLLSAHPDLKLTCATSRRYEGKPIEDVFPSLRRITDLVFSAPDPSQVARSASVAFTALPHETAMEFVPKLLDQGLKVVDLSADFRLKDAEVYGRWYQPHSAPLLLEEAAYGLPEIHRDAVQNARLVANPGCYPTSTILALAPLLRNGWIDPATIIVDSKSGASGAGRGPSMATLYCEVNEGFKAYKIGEHRHTPEIEQELSLLAGRPVTISFTPHLAPMNRGILTTTYASLTADIEEQLLFERARAFYDNAPFVRVLPPGHFPSTSFVNGSNYCDIGYKIDRRTHRIVGVSAIDNLVKGASGQAVQNMNLMLGLEETAGLRIAPLYP
ncbi:MAG: N-acetyl-gamma-glutamyl-phosphate reductase [Deltaproteobacteria bacterium]|nr:N-acetyl-gamma-glutamyl-phosphate reductase [Deltaproteobacteria bacterium]